MTATEPTKTTVGVGGFRERVLNILLGMALIASVPIVAVNASTAVTAGAYGLAAAYVGAFLFLLLLFFLKAYPQLYTWRVWGLMVVMYGVTTAAYTISGVVGDGRVWLLGTLAMGTLLLPEPHNFVNLVFGISYHFGMGFAFTHGWFPPPPNEPLLRSNLPAAWTRTGFTLVGVTLTLGAALVLYRRSLENTLEESETLNAILEKERRRLEEQGQTLERRLAQIRTASEIARVITTILDPDELIERVVNLVRDRFDLYYVGIFLVDERGEYAVLRAGTGEAGRKMLAEGHKLAIGGASMIGWSISNRKPRIALDVGEEAVRFANPHLPLTRTELALPLISHGEVLGAMTVQSERPLAFDEDDLAVLQSIVDNVATALHNARLYQEAQRGLQTLAETHRRFLAEAWQMSADTPDQVEIAVGTAEETPTPDASTYTLEVPISLYGQTLGTIVLENDTPWSEEDKDFANQAGAQLALAIENLYLARHAQQSARESRLLSDLSERLGATLDLNTILQTALREFQQILDVTEAEIHLVAPEATE